MISLGEFIDLCEAMIATGIKPDFIAATGVEKANQLERKHINRRISMNAVLKYDEIFPSVEVGSLVKKQTPETA